MAIHQNFKRMLAERPWNRRPLGQDAGTTPPPSMTFKVAMLGEAVSRRIFYYDATYATARDAAAGTITGPGTLYMGQQEGGGYTIHRTAILFGATPLWLPSTATVTGAKLRLQKRNSGGDYSGWSLQIQNGQPTYPSNPVVAGDYDRTKYSGDGGSQAAAECYYRYFTTVLNSTGLTWIQKAAITKFMLRSTADVAGNAPPGSSNQLMEFVRAESGYEHAPVLEVTYTDTPASELEFTDTALSTQLEKTDADYNTARDAPAATAVSGTARRLGAYWPGAGDWHVYRFAVLWNTTAIPDGATILDARIRLYLRANTASGFDLYVLQGLPTYPSNPVVVGDYDKSLYSVLQGVIRTEEMVQDSYNDIVLNYPAFANINKTGVTKFMIVTSNDSLTAPPGDSYIEIGSRSDSGQEPKLLVRHV
jgi:hypothetical protein